MKMEHLKLEDHLPPFSKNTFHVDFELFRVDLSISSNKPIWL